MEDFIKGGSMAGIEKKITVPIVLITGANGLIGSYTTLLFESLGYHVVPLDVMPRSKDLSLLPVRTPTNLIDVTDYTAFRDICRKEKITHIVHLAQPERVEEPGVLNFCLKAMHNILETAREMNISRVVFASSGAVYGPLRKSDRTPIKEDDPVSIYPTFLYRSVKILGEWLGDFYAQHHKIGFTALRFATVYGPGQAEGGSSFGAAIKHGILGRECRVYFVRVPDDLIFVKDVARAVQLACFREQPSSRVYNIASGKPYFEEDLERAMRRQLPGVSFTITKHPESVTVGQYRQRDILDVTRVRNELGFVPEVDLESGIAAIAEWVKKERNHLS